MDRPNIFWEGKRRGKDTLKLETNAESTSLKFMLDILKPEVIPANEIGVTFADIGALDEIKESLQDLVMLPLQRPDLVKGRLPKPCQGILLFGPAGTRKTMLVKAIANEAGASFINPWISQFQFTLVMGKLNSR
ncbi:P-loop containing nucleoside triphosphate hydrolases superfamily protein [Actinidia rufa]|uniref:P-loop containing nucleoside triphosphate hydrolases superfamily protein n=1 Tax=Actinidia rufa TaxID=165716 RepID=A0A7J0E5U7_9ERIC|nr:P-loop containing nucleoside triphosphate hydrolases superfamily protein [Actinidia rufa]